MSKIDPIEIIRLMKEPMFTSSLRAKRGVDLSPYERSLRTLLEEAAEWHDIELEEFKARYKYAKPLKLDDGEFDYRGHDEDPWLTAYWRIPANSDGQSREVKNERGRVVEPRRPLQPLAQIYRVTSAWWRARQLGTWRPAYKDGGEPDAPVLADMNPPLRLLFLVAQHGGSNSGSVYSVPNCLAVHDRLKSSSRQAKKALRQKQRRASRKA